LESSSPESIEGVLETRSTVYADIRGDLTEVFRRERYAHLFDDSIQVNCTRSVQGTIRGLHFHRFQTDVWFPVSGLMRAVLVDMRPDSKSFRRAVVFDIDAADPRELLIPPGVAHGYLAVTDACLLYVVDRYYDGDDEFGLAWDDPELAIDWGTESPILSERDRSNPCMADMTREWLEGVLGGEPGGSHRIP
jgi:dTDP-4-dehydrorhamnose 3,5-epimerase